MIRGQCLNSANIFSKFLLIGDKSLKVRLIKKEDIFQKWRNAGQYPLMRKIRPDTTK